MRRGLLRLCLALILAANFLPGCSLPKASAFQARKVVVDQVPTSKAVVTGRIEIVFNDENVTRGCTMGFYRSARTTHVLDATGLVAFQTYRPRDHDLLLESIEIPNRGRIDLPEPPLIVPNGHDGRVYYFGTLKIDIRQKLTSKVAKRVYDIRPIPRKIELLDEAKATFKELGKANPRLLGAAFYNAVTQKDQHAPKR